MSDTSKTHPGFFVDWDGKLRRVDQPGEGLRCEVDHKAKYVMVFNKHGGLDRRIHLVSGRGGGREEGHQGRPCGIHDADPDFVERLIFRLRE